MKRIFFIFIFAAMIATGALAHTQSDIRMWPTHDEALVWIHHEASIRGFKKFKLEEK
jgi:hypothetical protein